MNGNFDVWQRGTSLALADVTIQFLADRWADYVDKNGGTLPTLTRSRQLHTSGDIANSFYFTRLATDGAGTSLGANSRGTFIQRIENGVRNLCGAGKKVTVSFWARSSITNKRICPTIELNYGTGGSPTVTEFVNGTPITLTSTWTQYTATFTTNTLVGKTFGTANNDYIQLDIHYMWGTTFGNTYVQTGVSAETFVGSGNIDIAQVQLCAGDVALPFQPKSFEEELRACQRYYEKSFDYGVAPGASLPGRYVQPVASITAATVVRAHIIWKVKKRTTAPTVHTYGPVDGTIDKIHCYDGSNREVTATIAEQGETGARLDLTTPNNAAAATTFISYHWTSESEL